MIIVYLEGGGGGAGYALRPSPPLLQDFYIMALFLAGEAPPCRAAGPPHNEPSSLEAVAKSVCGHACLLE